MRTCDRTCDRICCKIRILHIFSTYNCVFKIAYAEILPHMRKCAYLDSHISAYACDRIFSELQTVKRTITRHTVQYRLLIKDWVPYRHRSNCQYGTVQTVRGVARISVWWDHKVERQRRDNRGAQGCKEGEWVSPSPLGVRSGEGCAPSL